MQEKNLPFEVAQTQPKDNNNQTQREEYLDGLRGWAALSVALYHSGETIPSNHFIFEPLHPILLQSPFGLFLDGGYAVQLFFILSGRVLAVSFIKRNSIAIVGALFRRPIRLIVPVIITWYFILSYHYLLPMLTGKPLEVIKQDKNLSFFGLMKMITLMFCGWNTPTVGLGHFEAWTLPWELWGSILVYILAAIHLSMPSQNLFFPMFVYLVARWNDSLFCLFVAGYILCYCREKGYFIKPSSRMISVTIQVLLFISVWIMNYPVGLHKNGGDKPDWPGYFLRTSLNEFMHHNVIRDPKEGRFRDPYRSRHVRCETDIWGIVLLLILLEYSRHLRAFFSSKFSIFLGKISFGLYLGHFATLRFLAKYYGTSPDEGTFFEVLQVLGITLFVGWNLTHLADMTALKASHYGYNLFFVDKRSWCQVWQDRPHLSELLSVIQKM